MLYTPPTVTCEWLIRETPSEIPQPYSVSITDFRDYHDQLRAKGCIFYMDPKHEVHTILWKALGSYNGKFSWLLKAKDSNPNNPTDDRVAPIELDLIIRYFLVVKLEQLAKFRRNKPGEIKISETADLHSPETPFGILEEAPITKK